MNQSILNSIKLLLGIPEEYPVFDPVILIHINTVFSILHQIGASPVEGFYIEDDSSKWQDFLVNPAQTNLIKTYMYLKIRLMWETDALTGPTTAAIEKQLQDLEARLTMLEFHWNPKVYEFPNIRTVPVIEDV